MIMSGRRLFWRIYINGLLLLISVVLAVTVTTILVQPESRFHGKPEQVFKVVATELARHLDDHAELQATLDRFVKTLHRNGVIYTKEGTLLIASGNTLLLPLDVDDFDKIGGWHPIHQSGGGWVHAVSLGDNGDTYLLMEGRDSGGGRFFIFLLTVLFVVAVVSLPLVKALTRPLERLTATSRALAAGDLSARSGVDRRDEIGELARALDEMARQLDERIRNEKELLANISHEIRTPLARLRVALELCEDSPEDSHKTIRHLQGMSADLSELESLIEHVLTSARLDLAQSGRSPVPLRLCTIVLVDFFNEVSSRFARRYHGQQLKMNIPVMLPIITGDPALLHRLCDNLLSNAVKYSSPGSPILFTVLAETAQVRVEVSDCGEGVPQEDLDKLFDPFFRSDRCRTRKTGGSGLGLTLCKRIVEAHGGSISARLNAESGMTFCFILPLKHGP
jgi:signal transduction histidine kinase